MTVATLSPTVRTSRGPRLFTTALRTFEGRIGLALLIVVLAVAFLGRFVAPRDPDEFVGLPFERTGASTPFGTDNLGRDVWSRFLVGGQSLVLMAVIATAVGVTIGIALGLAAASARQPWRGEAVVACTDLVLVFPQLVLALLFVSLLGPRLWLVCLLVGVAHVPRTTRVTRTCAAAVLDREFVQAARAMGLPRRRILVNEVLPNISAPLLVELGLSLALSAAFVGALNFLGFGIQPPASDWGLMINENQIGLALSSWGVVLPTLAIALFTVGANLLADSIARAGGTSILVGEQV